MKKVPYGVAGGGCGVGIGGVLYPGDAVVETGGFETAFAELEEGPMDGDAAVLDPN